MSLTSTEGLWYVNGMYPLYQRLKEMDGDLFQRFCFQLLKERHPGADLRHVEGASGDEGLDIFEGALSGEPVIWQCKAFPNGIGKSQKQQVRDSLKTALQSFAIKKWILCLSVDMETDAYRWFQRSRASEVEIGLFSASDIVHELIHRRSLRNAFFEGAVIDVQEWKRAVTRSGELDAQELERVTETNLEDYIKRLKERDSRFNYEIVFSGDLGPAIYTSRKGLLLSVGNGSKRLNVYARDIEALKQSPVDFKVTFKGAAAEKLQSLLRTGVPQEFSSAEIENVSSNFFLLQDHLKMTPSSTLAIGPSEFLTQRHLRARVSFSLSGEPVEYGLIEFAPVRAGTDEVELKSVGIDCPSRCPLFFRSQASHLVSHFRRHLLAMMLAAFRSLSGLFLCSSMAVRSAFMTWTTTSNFLAQRQRICHCLHLSKNGSQAWSMIWPKLKVGSTVRCLFRERSQMTTWSRWFCSPNSCVRRWQNWNHFTSAS